MNTQIIYHEVKPGVPCPDGLAAAWVAHKVYPEASLHGWTYGDSEVPEASKGDRLVIVDFSFSADVTEGWIRGGVELTVIDHHKTAQEALSQFDIGNLQTSLEEAGHKWNVLFDMKESGATLAWRHFFRYTRMPVFLEYVKDRDLWNHSLMATEEIHEATGALRRSFALYDVLELMSMEELIRFLAPLGAKLLKPKREKVKAIADQHEYRVLKTPIGEYEIPVVQLAADTDRLASDVCAYLYERHLEAPFTACITSQGAWSLRSDKKGNDTDVSAIAKSMGGGGHRNAAGFTPKEGDRAQSN